jgi:hypothetical protein
MNVPLVETSIFLKMLVALRQSRNPALQNILEKSVRELGEPLGGWRVDRSALKVESNHWGRALARCEPRDIPTGLIGLTLHYCGAKSFAET